MADPRFFRRAGAKPLAELAELTGSVLSENAVSSLKIADVAPLDHAGSSDLAFFDNVKYREQLRTTKAGACILSPDSAKDAPAGVALLLNKSPYKAYALIAQAFYPEPPLETPRLDASRHVHVSSHAKMGKGCVVETGAVIKEGATVGENTLIGANAVIGENVVIGAGCRIGANAVISHAIIGDHVRIYPGCCIGQDGFGFAIDPAGYVKVPQLGRVIIEDHVEIGANTCVDRGAGPDTVIGQGTWIDNLVQIGHNVKIGKGCVIVAQVGISGSTVIGDYAMLGGQVGVAGHLHIGKGARIAAQSGLMRDVEAGAEVMGSPALPIKQHLRQVAFLARMIKKGKE